MGHYDDSYEYENNQRRIRRYQASHDIRKDIRAALSKVDTSNSYDADQLKIKLKEALFWLDGPNTLE